MEHSSHIRPNPTEAEAAAAIAGIELFVAETAIVASSGADRPTGWKVAASFEAVGLHDPDSLW